MLEVVKKKINIKDFLKFLSILEIMNDYGNFFKRNLMYFVFINERFLKYILWSFREVF